MATTLTTMYPPQVGTFMPSFCYNSAAKVWFNIASFDEEKIDQIQYIHISMVDQRNNKNIFMGISSGNTQVYPQYYPIAFNGNKEGNNNTNNKMGYDPEKKMYWLQIPPQLLKTSPYYNPGQYYKVQLRFDLTGSQNYDAFESAYTNPTSFFYWNSASSKKADALKLATYTMGNADNFSEWSTGTLLKPILIPNLSLQKFNVSNREEINPSTDVLVSGKIKFTKASGDSNTYTETEHLSWYQIQVFNTSKTILYTDTEKIYSDINSKTSINEINCRIDVSQLDVNSNYSMVVIYETNNGYHKETTYPIKIINYSTSSIVTCDADIDEEMGLIILHIGGISNYHTGQIIVRRSSHHSNFKYWDLIAICNAKDRNGIDIIDNTIESMTGYRYQIQYVVGSETYKPLYIDSNSIMHCDFYGGLLSDGEKTLSITFNLQLANRANAINKTKVDTLGGQYPIFTKNSKLKYHTYGISGTISSEDGGETFLPKQQLFGAEYYRQRYNPTVSPSTVHNHFFNTNKPTPHTSQCDAIKPHNDWLYEREYRDAVEDWLNNGKPKLFRSMTEGNMIVMLDGVALTPDVTLGRRLYNFNATMYEMGDGQDLETITSFGLFNRIEEKEN